ncbi:MAG: glycosyltransferase family 39 protein [Thermoanaerobaculia bacterium]
MRSSKSSALAAAAAFALAGLAVFLVRDHTREDAMSIDEPIHILSGYFSVASRSAIVNLEHPPLMKVLAGLALSSLPLAPAPAEVPMDSFLTFGPAFFFSNRVPVDQILATARAPFLLVYAALVLLVFFAARSRYGNVPALLAAALLALDSNLIAHAGVVHTDLGAALMFPAAVLAWEAARRRPTALRLLLAALTVGLALVTKFSTVYLIPILLLQTLLAPRSPDAGPGLGKSLLRLTAVGAGALVVVFAVYALVTARMDREAQKAVLREMIATKGGDPVLAERLVRLAQISPALAQYAGGIASVARHNTVGGISYLNGRISTSGFPEYFLVAFLVKSTLAFLAITATVLVAAIRRWSDFAQEMRLFLLPVAVLFLASVGSSYNLGIRHLLPVYSFLALLASALFARVWARRRESRGARVAAALWLLLPVVSAIETARIHPHELSYFNALAGGPEGGRKILSDSNVDWGLDLRRLKAELERRGIAGPTVSYFGGDNVSYRLGLPDFSALPVVRGNTVAISAFFEAAGPEFYAYHGFHELAGAMRKLQRRIAAEGRLIGRVGYSIHLYELSPGGRP